MAGMPPVTASFGVVDAEDDELLDELFRRADALLFEAKHAGRDRIRVDGVPEREVGVFELETVELQR
jgi:predicted signal transduction protein with EAL and GGDEF domain